MSDIKLKPIKPGMAIHCPTEEEAEKLFKHLDRLGYEWWNDGGFLIDNTIYDRYGKNTCYFIVENKKATCGDINDLKNAGAEVTEFYDLIEPELTAEEVVDWLMKHYCDGKYKEAFGIDYDFSQLCINMKPEEIVRKIEQWKADHEKKEPEVEWVDICRIIEILPDNRKRCVYEEEIKSELPFGGDEKEKVEGALKRYCKEHDGNFFAAHEVVCREKAIN